MSTSSPVPYEATPHTLWEDAIDNNTGPLGQPIAEDLLDVYTVPERIISVAEGIRIIGASSAPLPRADADGDPDLGVKLEHLELIHPDKIADGLYYPKNGRFDGVISQRVRVYNGRSNLKLPGMVAPNIAVTFHEDDHSRLAHSPGAMSSHAHSTTLARHPITSNNPEQRRNRSRKSDSSAAKNMARKIEATDRFMDELQTKRLAFASLWRGLRANPPVRYRPENALGLIAVVDHELRRMIEVSGQERAISEDDRAASQRALTSVLYRLNRDDDDIKAAWRVFTKVGGYYLNAQLGKADESRNAATDIYTDLRHRIKPEERAAFDLVVYGNPDELQEIQAAA